MTSNLSKNVFVKNNLVHLELNSVVQIITEVTPSTLILNVMQNYAFEDTEIYLTTFQDNGQTKYLDLNTKM